MKTAPTHHNDTPASLMNMIDLAAEECITIRAEDFDGSEWVNAQATLIERIQRQPWHDDNKNYRSDVVVGQIRLMMRRQVMRLLGHDRPPASDDV